jgi:hypothetical protein
MHVKGIYVIFIHLFDSGILLIIDLNKKKVKRGGGIYLWILQLNKCYVSTVKEKNKNLLRLKLISALKIEQISGFVNEIYFK